MPDHRSVVNTGVIGSDRQSRESVQARLSHLPSWKLEDAKARFSQLVRLARTEGPQRVTYRGAQAVVVLAVEEFERLLGADMPRRSLVQFLQGSGLGDIEVTRDEDRGREVAL
jgi:prevent-host-death family protein